MLKLRELIKKVRLCKTAEEERSVINKESAEIRNMGKEQSDLLKSRNLAKCVFMHMLGYPMEFIQMTCVNLLASSKFTDKRIAYVALCVLMDEKSEVLLLTSHTIKKDLESSNQYIVAASLNAIGEICTSDMCRDASTEVTKLLNNSNPYIKKKAALAMSKIIRKCPELLDTVAEKLNPLFEDKNHGVLLSGLCLACQIFRQEPSYVDKYKKYIPNLMRFLKNLSSTSYDPGYDMNGVTDPFLQVKILETLYYFGKNNPEASEDMNDLLASISTNTNSDKNTGNAVLYELVRTIIGIESNSGLKSLSSSILGKFLGHKDNNYKYVSLNTLQEVAKSDLNSVQKHKAVILECLKDSDISIKRRSLDLIYLIINSSNIKSIMKECLNFLLIAENEFKLELTAKLCQSLEKYSPSLKWQIDTVVKMLCLAGNFVNDETVSSTINLIISTPELSLYSVHKVFIAMKNNLGQEGLVKVGIYTLGELGHILISNSVTGPDDEDISVSEEEVMALIEEINTRRYSPQVKEYLLNCCIKLTTKFSDKSVSTLQNLIESELTSYHCEVQQRATEYNLFAKLAAEKLKRDITKTVPNSKVVKEADVKKEITIDEYDNDTEESNKGLLIKFDKSQIVSNTEISESMTKKETMKKVNNSTNGLIDQFNDIFGNSSAKEGGAKVNTDLESIFGNFGTIDFTAVNAGENKQPSNPVPSHNDLFSNLNLIYNESNSNPVVNLGNPTFTMPLTTIIPGPNTFAPTLNLIDNSLLGGFSQTQQHMKQVFKNEEITVLSSFTKTFDKTQVNGAFFISNNTSKFLSNVKLNLSVKKSVLCKVNSTTGTVLEPMKSLGIKKDVSLTNTDPEKEIAMKITYAYTIDGGEISNSFMIENI